MGNFVGGDVTEVTYNHETVGEGTIYCKAAEDATVKLGGYMNVDDDNNVTGDGQYIQVKNRVAWSVELPPVLWDQTDINELDKLQQIADSPLKADWTVAFVNGAIYSGNGQIVGDLSATTNDPHITVKLQGGGKLVKIA